MATKKSSRKKSTRRTRGAGPPRALTDKQVAQVRKKIDEGHTFVDVAKELGVATMTLYRAYHRLGAYSA